MYINCCFSSTLFLLTQVWQGRTDISKQIRREMIMSTRHNTLNFCIVYKKNVFWKLSFEFIVLGRYVRKRLSYITNLPMLQQQEIKSAQLFDKDFKIDWKYFLLRLAFNDLMESFIEEDNMNPRFKNLFNKRFNYN